MSDTMEQLRIAKMISKANGSTGFYLDLVTVEVLGILEQVENGSRRVPGKLIVSNEHGEICADVKIDVGGSFYVNLRKGDLDALQIYYHYIGALNIRYDPRMF